MLTQKEIARSIMDLGRSVHTESCLGTHQFPCTGTTALHSSLLHTLFQQELLIFPCVRQKHHKGQVPGIAVCTVCASLCALTMWAMMLSLCREGCLLNRTMSPSIRWRSTMSPNFSSCAIFSRFPYFKNLHRKREQCSQKIHRH